MGDVTSIGQFWEKIRLGSKLDFGPLWSFWLLYDQFGAFLAVSVLFGMKVW